MGKNQRLRKQELEEKQRAEEQAIKERKKSRLAPNYSMIRRLVFCLILTGLILVGGAQVDQRLDSFIRQINGHGVDR